MTSNEVAGKYNSDDDELRKLPDCPYCPFEEIIKSRNIKAGILNQEIPKGDHPHRGKLEEGCGRDVDEPCEIKYAMMRVPLTDYNLAQFEAVKTFKLDVGKNSGIDLDRNHAYGEWTRKRFELKNSNRKATSYAIRWEEIWNLSLCMNGHHSLTELGIYRIVASPNKEYQKEVDALKLLSLREKERHDAGIPLEDICND